MTESLPDNRAALLVIHAEARRRRDRAELGGPQYRAACAEVATIEVQIARIEQAPMPPITTGESAPTASEIAPRIGPPIGVVPMSRTVWMASTRPIICCSVRTWAMEVVAVM